MKARIKGECEMREFTPLFSSKGFIGFVDARWYEAHKEKQSDMDVIAPYPMELLVFEEDEKRRLEDIRVNASIAAMAKLMPDHLYDNKTHYVCEYDEKVRKQQIVVATKAVGYANALVEELRRTAVKDETDENHCLTK